MNQPTHYLNVTLGIDFTQIFAPERINGVKFMLGVESDEDVINQFSNNIIIDMQKAVEIKKDYVGFINANINPIPEEAVPKDVPVEHYEEIEEAPSEYYAEEDVVESYAGEALDESELHYDSYGISLVEAVNNDIFSIQSHLGANITLYLREYDMYANTVANELGDEIAIAPLEQLGEEAIDLQSEDYVIEYKDMQGEVKYGKRNLNKKEDLEESV